MKCDYCGEDIDQEYCPDCLKWTLKDPSKPLRDDFDPSEYSYTPDTEKDKDRGKS